jgi:hypothetical protein
MIDKDPMAWDLSTWLFVLTVSCAGGLVNWLKKLRQGHTNAFKIVEFIGEVFTSGFVGLMVFMVMHNFDQPIGINAACAGVAGHMATRILFLIERILESKALKAANITLKDLHADPKDD